jgi:hypothetical protein
MRWQQSSKAACFAADRSRADNRWPNGPWIGGDPADVFTADPDEVNVSSRAMRGNLRYYSLVMGGFSSAAISRDSPSLTLRVRTNDTYQSTSRIGVPVASAMGRLSAVYSGS